MNLFQVGLIRSAMLKQFVGEMPLQMLKGVNKVLRYISFLIGCLFCTGLLLWRGQTESRAKTANTSMSHALTAPKSGSKLIIAKNRPSVIDSVARTSVTAATVAVLNSLKSEVLQLDPTDQVGLDELYESAHRLIRDHEDEVLANMSQTMPELVNGPVESSFFMLSSFIKFSRSPEKALDALWSYAPPQEEDSGNDEHGSLATPSGNYKRLEAYALSKIRNRVRVDGVLLGSSARVDVVAALVARTKTVSSLNVSIEMFQLLKELHAPDEIASALHSYSDEDREIIQSVL